MDRIEISGLRVRGFHGVLASEQRDGQVFVVDLALERDLGLPARTDALADTVDYGTLAALLAAAVRDTRFDLIEALAGHLARLALDATDARAVTVRVAKPEAPVDAEVDEVAVVLRRERDP